MTQRRPKQPWDDPRWKRLRLKILARDHYRCFKCGGLATNVDHIQPASEAPHLFLDPTNLRASCDRDNYGRVSKRAAAVVRLNQAIGTRRAW